MKFAAMLAALPALSLAADNFFSNRTSLTADELVFNRTRIEEFRLRKRQSNVVLANGIQNQGVQPRLEIRTMQNEQSEQLTLLFFAMAYFQANAENDDTGYWGLSKIHGVPRQSWNGVEACDQCGQAPDGSGPDGYCQHSTLVFPCFHRAYVALFEEHLIETAQAIAYYWPTQNGGDSFRQAASTMRLPYWDWAANPASGDHSLPQAISSPQVTLTDENNNRQTINNPLYAFKFNGPNSPGDLVYADFNAWGTTLRYPSSADPSATSEESVMVSNIDTLQPSQRDSLYTLLSGCSSYFDFSNDVAGGSGACVTSLEQLHNNIHIWVGGQSTDQTLSGHMAILSEAAYDPVFWLHHAMVDRVFAMWQTLHSDYSGSQKTIMTTWSTPNGYTFNMDTGIPPFRNTENSFHSCQTVQDWTKFGYTYPEYTISDGSSTSIQHYVDALYGPQASSHAGDPNAKRDLTSMVSGVMAGAMSGLNDTLSAVNKTMTDLLSPTQAANGSLFQYFADIHTPRFTLGGSYSVCAFHGQPTSLTDTSKWLSDPNIIGSIGVFSNPGMTANKMLISGQIPLTTWATQAQKDGLVENLSPAAMVPFLQKHLALFIIGPNGKPVDVKTVDGFRLNVTSSTLDTNKPSGQQFSKFHKLTDVADSVLSKLGL